jgi:4'-phosphopantetheinyl transferase
LSRRITLFPVILPVAKAGHRLSGSEKVARLSRISREALKLSAGKWGVTLGELQKDENDVPCPFDGHYWSLTHKSKYVAAVVGKDKIGIDIEEIKPRSKAIFSLVASDEEWERAQDRSLDIFFRYWTAKEAVLKAIGIGIGGLKTCRVVSVPDEHHIILDYRDHTFRVEQLYHKNHIVSVLKEDNEIEWIIEGNIRYD